MLDDTLRDIIQLDLIIMMKSSKIIDEEADFVHEEDRLECEKCLRKLQLISEKARENAEYFSGPNRRDAVDQAFCKSFNSIHENCEHVGGSIEYLYRVAARFDIDATCRANGFRSWLKSFDRLIEDLLERCHYIEQRRSSVFFRRVKNARQLTAISDCLQSMRQCVELLSLYPEVSPDSLVMDPSLDENIDLHQLIDIISSMRLINVAAFRGRAPCYHFDKSVDHLADGILLTFAAYCQAFKSNNTNQTATDQPLFESPPTQEPTASRPAAVGGRKSESQLKWLISSDAMADQVRWGLANLPLEHLQLFWSFGDHPYLLAGIDMLIPQISLSQVINLHSVPITVKTSNGTRTLIEPPDSITGIRPTKSRLISSNVRQGQVCSTRNELSKVNPLCCCLFSFYCTTRNTG